MNYKLEEQDVQKETPKKLPYNLREKREKQAAYRSMIRADLADELYQKIYDIVIVKKNYKDPNFSSKDLAKMLQTNTRYLSAVVNSRFGMNFSCLLNEYRIKDALRLLADKKNAEKNIEEISAMVGFANRQSFYAAFYRIIGETPNGYRKKVLSAKLKKWFVLNRTRYEKENKSFPFFVLLLTIDKNEETINDGSHGNDVVCWL